MKTKYTIHYWYHDEHDQLQLDRDTLEDAVHTIKSVLGCNYKDYLIVARHYQRVNEPFEYKGKTYDDWTWELADDNFIEYYDEFGNRLLEYLD